MSQSLLAARLLLQQATRPTASASLSTLTSSSTQAEDPYHNSSITFALSSRHSPYRQRRLLSFNPNHQNKNNNILKHDTQIGAATGAVAYGIANGFGALMRGEGIHHSINAFFSGVVSGGIEGGAAGAVIGAVRSDNPEDKLKIVRALAKGVLIGGGIGATLGGIGTSLFIYIVTEESFLTIPAFFVGALIGGFSGAKTGAVLGPVYIGLTARSTEPPTPTCDQKFNELDLSVEKLKLYWDPISKMKATLSIEDFEAQLLLLEHKEFTTQFDELKKTKLAYEILAQNPYLDTTRKEYIDERLVKMSKLIKSVESLPTINQINECTM